MIGKRIAEMIKPRLLRIASFWNPRGGIPIDVFWQTGKLPDGVWLPDTASRPIAAAAERRLAPAGRAVGSRPAGAKGDQLALMISLAIIFPF